MTTASLEERLAQRFGEAAVQGFVPRWLSAPRRSQMFHHQQWLRSEGRFGRQLVLDRRDFDRTWLNVEDFSRSKLSRINFNWSDLRLTSFAGAELRHVHFHACDMEGSSFKGAILENVIFEDCVDMDKSCFDDVTVISWPEERVLNLDEKRQFAWAAKLANS